MSESKSTPSARTAAKSAPQLVSPIDGALVDAAAVPFRWSDDPGESSYVLQVAGDAQFEEVVATISVGEASGVTLYDTLLDHRDEDLFWRVRSGERGPWSEPAVFHAAGPDRLQAEREKKNRAARETARAALERHLEGEHRMPVVLPEKADSDRLAVTLLAAIVVSFVLLLIILFIFGHIEYPAEAQV